MPRYDSRDRESAVSAPLRPLVLLTMSGITSSCEQGDPTASSDALSFAFRPEQRDGKDRE